MLKDIERKLLRILWNYHSARNRQPTMHELKVKTGRREKDFVRALVSLHDQHYIDWDGATTASIHIIRGWETKGTASPAPISDYSRFMD